MPKPSDFDPAKAIQDLRQQRAAEEAKKRVAEEAEERLKRAEKAARRAHRADMLRLLRYADEELEGIRNPVVSEFDVTEWWWTLEPQRYRRWVSNGGGSFAREEIYKKLRAGQELVDERAIKTKDGFFARRTLYEYTIATRHMRETPYHGSWLLMSNCLLYTIHFSGDFDPEEVYGLEGMVKLRRPHAGYAYVKMKSSTGNGQDPRGVGSVHINLTDNLGNKIPNDEGNYQTDHERRRRSSPFGSLPHYDFQVFSSLVEAPEVPLMLSIDIEEVAKNVEQALHFVATGEPPDPNL
jgi:hypothetical protein